MSTEPVVECCPDCGRTEFGVARDAVGTRHCSECRGRWLPSQLTNTAFRMIGAYGMKDYARMRAHAEKYIAACRVGPTDGAIRLRQCLLALGYEYQNGFMIPQRDTP